MVTNYINIKSTIKIFRSQLFSNMSYLFIVQIANYLIPLITIPYLIRVIGVDNFGIIAFAISFTQYFVIIVDYGFNYTATRVISVNRENIEEISKEFMVVFSIKLLLLTLCFIIELLLIAFVPKFRIHSLLFFICFFMAVGNFVYPIWLFQGLEKIKHIAVINLTTKVVFAAAIFIFVKNPSDYYLVAAFQAGSVFFSGIIALVLSLYLFNLKWRIPKAYELIQSLREGWPIFATFFSSTLVNNTNIFILGLLTDNKTTGYFSIADKIVRVLIYLALPINTVLFPRISKLFVDNKEKAIVMLKSTLKYGIIFFAFLSILLFIFTELIVRLVSGSTIQDVSIMVRIMAIVPLTVFIDNVYGTQVLINLKKGNQFLKSVFVPSFISIILALIFVPIWKGFATAVIYLVAEVTILVMMVYHVRKNGFYLIIDKYI